MTSSATAIRRGGAAEAADSITLAHDARRVRRKLLTTASGAEVLIDFAETTTLDDGDALVLDGGGLVGIRSAIEKLYEIRGDISRLAWHLGNRHLPAEIHPDRILIARDKVIYAMLVGLGATVRDTEGPFTPIEGAYHNHGHALLNR